MPVCFQLIDKTTKQAAVLQKVDDEMRKHFGAEPSETEWFKNWYNTIGFSLAMGHSWQKISETWNDRIEVIEWLQANYTTDNWREMK